jgi:mRNA-degrading endonuclease RelE of RelBE toxin-antitoxin system
MTYQLKSLPKFEKQFKKLHPKEQTRLREELAELKTDPTLGERKKGVLSSIRVHKFKIHHQLYLLAYEAVEKEKVIYLYAVATHENFYEALERSTSPRQNRPGAIGLPRC